MSKPKTISITALDKILKEAPRERVVDFHGNDLRIKYEVDFADTVRLVDGVVASCFGDEEYAYRPEVMEFALRFGIVSTYTDMRLPDDTEHKYHILFSTDLVDVVSSAVNPEQIKCVRAAIDRKIDYLVHTDIMSARMELAKITAKVDAIAESIQHLFENVSSNDVSAALSAITAGGVDESKLMEAYLRGTTDQNKAVVVAEGDANL